jgi:gliding motility-associated-like protein
VRGYGVEAMEFKVFNRWGELVFESYDINNGWDGTYKSKTQEMEVYVYTLQARFLDGTETGIRKGNVTLLR